MVLNTLSMLESIGGNTGQSMHEEINLLSDWTENLNLPKPWTTTSFIGLKEPWLQCPIYALPNLCFFCLIFRDWGLQAYCFTLHDAQCLLHQIWTWLQCPFNEFLLCILGKLVDPREARPAKQFWYFASQYAISSEYGLVKLDEDPDRFWSPKRGVLSELFLCLK